MSAALARQWDYYDDEEDLVDVEDGLETLELHAPAYEYEFYDEVNSFEAADDALTFPQPFQLPAPSALNVQPFSYDPTRLPTGPTVSLNWFGEEGQALTTDAVYAYGYQETRPRRDWVGEAADGLQALSRNRLVVGLVMALIGWLVVSNVLNWLSKPQDGATEIYNFGASAAVAPPVQNQSLESKLPPPSVAPGAHAVEGRPSLTTDRIDQILQSYHSPAAGKGQAFYDLGVKYGIDPAYALAFFIHESSAGTQGVAVTTKSIGNIRYTSDSGFEDYQNFRKYPSWEASIEDWYKLIGGLYVKGWNLRTVETIIPKYAPTADHNSPPAYINHVNSLVEGWRSGK